MISNTMILVVDDDLQLLQEVQSYLQKLGYEVATAEDGPSALKKMESISPNLVVLDIVFPESKKTGGSRSMDGVEILRRLRELEAVPVLMLSASNITAVKVMSLRIGADDFLAKPFEMEELGARIEAILRRTEHESPEDQALIFSRLRLDPGERRVWKDDRLLDFTTIEFDILYTLARRPHHVFTRDKLIDIAWKANTFCVSKAVDVHIGHIRKKIEDDPANPAFIVTVRGTGYSFEDNPV